MEESSNPRGASLPVLVTILVAAVVTGAVLSAWSYQETKRQRVHETVVHSLEEELQEQTNRLEEQERVNQQLADKLSMAGKTGLELESELSDTREQLSDARNRLSETSEELVKVEAELTALKEMDWESRYDEAMQENETLSEKLAAMELQQSLRTEEMEEMRQTNDSLTADKKTLLQDYSFLELERDDLARSYEQLREKYIASMEQQEKLLADLAHEESLAKERIEYISKLEETIGKNERIISRLRSEIDSYESMIGELQQDFAVPEPVPEQTIDDKPEIIVSGTTERKQATDGDYRFMRLQSLTQAMDGRGSVERKQILISVIPTIPNGISGDELAALITGMNSSDILSVIQSTRKHISRPLDDKSLSILFSSMTRKDADQASVILASDS